MTPSIRPARVRQAVTVALPLLLLTACAPNLVLKPSPTVHNFGNVLVGTRSAASPAVTWTNSGQPLTVDAIDVDAPFAIVAPAPALPANVATGAPTPAVTFQFTPRAVGPARSGATPLSTQLVAPDEAQPVALFGTGVAQATAGTLSVTGGQLIAGQILDFGRVVVPGGTPVVRTFTVKNSGTTPALVDARFVVVAGVFTVTSPAPGPIPVPPGGTVDVILQFAPSSVGDFTDTVTFVDRNNPANWAGTALAGKGVAGD